MSSNTWDQQYNAINYAQEMQRRERSPSTPPTQESCYDLWFAESGINTKETARDGVRKEYITGTAHVEQFGYPELRAVKIGLPGRRKKPQRRFTNVMIEDREDWSDKGG